MIESTHWKIMVFVWCLLTHWAVSSILNPPYASESPHQNFKNIGEVPDPYKILIQLTRHEHFVSQASR